MQVEDLLIIGPRLALSVTNGLSRCNIASVKVWAVEALLLSVGRNVRTRSVHASLTGATESIGVSVTLNILVELVIDIFADTFNALLAWGTLNVEGELHGRACSAKFGSSCLTLLTAIAVP